jgi:hypothetical protein
MSGPPDKDYTAPDDLAAAIEPTHSRDERDADERQLPPREERSDGTSDIDTAEKYDDTDGDRDDDTSHRKDEEVGQVTRPVAALTNTKSYATDTSAATGAPAPQAPPEDKPWYKKTNPLRWGGVPPIPEERIVSRETDAGFLSRVTWGWMTPLMTVRCNYSLCGSMACCLFKVEMDRISSSETFIAPSHNAPSHVAPSAVPHSHRTRLGQS